MNKKTPLAFNTSSPHSWPQSNDHKPRVLRHWNRIGSAQKRLRATLKLDPNSSSHRVRPPLCTLSVLRARRADVSVGWFILPGFLPSPPTDSVLFLPAHAVAVPLCVRLEDSEPGQRRHLGTYFIKMTRWRVSWRVLVARCLVGGKKRTERSRWTRILQWTYADLLKFYFMGINYIFIRAASTYSLSYFPADT